MSHQDLRSTIRSFYDFQKIRIEISNRISADKREKLYSEERKEELKQEFESIKALEKNAEKQMKRHLKTWPNQTIVQWFKDQPGIGHTIAAFILAEIDITKCETVSSLWKYSGMAVDQKTGKSDRRVKGQKLSYNPMVKTRLLGVMADNLLRSAAVAKNDKWRKFYDDYKHRKTTAGWGASDGHRHRAALRYMVKMLMLELWQVWRESEGLATPPSYQEVYGAAHGQHGLRIVKEAS